VLGLHDDRLGQRDGMTLRAVVERLAAPWAEGLRALFAAADPSTVTALPIRSAGRLTPWTASRVTALGDAIHAMSPAGGVGANTALDDAVCLAGLLAGVSDAGIPLLEAIAAYEDDMRRRANAAIEASTQGARRLFREAVASL
jgi:salicylate hydroxylase